MILDVSNYDFATFDADCLKAAGVTGIILGCQNPKVANAMGLRAQSAGIPIIGVYGFDYFGTPGNLGDIRDAITIAFRFGVRRVWIDCEADSGMVTPAERVAEIHECVNAVKATGLEPGIYTGAWWWGPNTEYSTEFADLPLWHSAYFDDGREVREVDYGGWTKVAIHQWTSTLSLCGRGRDANYVFEEEPMTPAEKAEFDAMKKRIYQLETQAWGENPTPRDEANAYAPVTMHQIADHLANHSAGVHGAEGHTHAIEVRLK